MVETFFYEWTYYYIIAHVRTYVRCTTSPVMNETNRSTFSSDDCVVYCDVMTGWLCGGSTDVYNCDALSEGMRRCCHIRLTSATDMKPQCFGTCNLWARRPPCCPCVVYPGLGMRWTRNTTHPLLVHPHTHIMPYKLAFITTKRECNPNSIHYPMVNLPANTLRIFALVF
jgi:hypothetical protein